MAVNQTDDRPSFTIINTKMTVQSMRDSGYKSTTHALAELIDNSIESDALSIELFGVSRKPNEGSSRYELKELAVLDNGKGMDPGTLRGSLRYGYGTRTERRGIGRFGLGLPNSSMSQARRVDVWSWQSGVTNALHTYLSIDEVEQGILEQIPEPDHLPIPKVYREGSRHEFSDSGTLVVWTELDRVEWKRAATTFKHTELFLGRVYRRFLASPSERLHKEDSRNKEIGHRRSIMCIPIKEDAEGIESETDGIVEVKPNDPLYLMSDTSCPELFGEGPMFTELVDRPFVVPIIFGGKKHEVRVRASYVRPYARDPSHEEAAWPENMRGWDSGSTLWGKHADQNRGVSVMRAHREIQLDDSWTSGDDPRERWWTVEVDFPAELDEVFGVTNNKQGTMTFQRLAQYDWQRDALLDETEGDVRRRMEEDGDPRIYLLNLRKQIMKAIELMRPRVREAAKKRSRHGIDENKKADQKATAAIKRRIVEGHEGKSDRIGASGTEEEHAKAQERLLVDRHHFEKEDALRRIDETIKAGNRVRWIQSAQDHSAFFSVEPLPNVIQVALNTNHPVYAHLYEIMHPEIDDMAEDKVRERLAKSAAAFRVLVYSWARYEDETTGKEQRKVRDMRQQWGKYAEEFFDEDDGSIAPTDLV